MDLASPALAETLDPWPLTDKKAPSLTAHPPDASGV